QRIVPEHGDAIEDGVPVACQLSFGKHRGAIRIGGEDSAGRLDVRYPLDKQIALRKHLVHGSLLFRMSFRHAAVPNRRQRFWFQAIKAANALGWSARKCVAQSGSSRPARSSADLRNLSSLWCRGSLPDT